MDQNSKDIVSRTQLDRQFRRTLFLGIFLEMLVIVVGVAVTWLVFSQSRLTSQREMRLNFEKEVTEVVARFQESFGLYSNNLRALRGFFVSSEKVEGAEWQNFIDNLQLDPEFIKFGRFSFSDAVRRENLPVYEAEIRGDLSLNEPAYRTFSVWPQSENGWLYPVRLLSPLTNNSELGFDRGSDPERSMAINRAIDSGQIEASPVLESSFGESSKSQAYYLAVFRPGTTLNVSQGRHDALMGILALDVNPQAAFSSFFAEEIPLSIEIYDAPQGTLPSEGNLLFDSEPDSLFATGVAGDTLREVIEISIGGRPTSLYFSSLPFEPLDGDSPENYVLTIGILVSILLAIIVGFLIMQRLGAYRLAVVLTKDLAEKQRAMLALIANLPGAVYRHLNEPSMKFTFVTSKIESLTGYTPAEFLEGRVTLADLVTADQREQVWRSIQQSLETRTGFHFNFMIKDKLGRSRWLFAQGQAVFDTSGRVSWVEGFISDITERIIAESQLKVRAEELARLNQLLVGRELKMRELKAQLGSLTGKN